MAWICCSRVRGDAVPRVRADSARSDERALPGKVPMAERSIDSASCRSTMPLLLVSREELLMAEVRCALMAADVERLEPGWMTASRREPLKEAGAVSAPLATSMA